MRPVLSAQVCLAVFQAFLFAPAQHVHEAHDEAHEHSTLVHSHFSAHHAVLVHPGERAISESEEHEAWALDTFTIVLSAGQLTLLLSRAPDVLPAPRPVMGAVALVEPRAHDPPPAGLPTPRGPPV
jgi:hypothetical protein